MPKLSKRQRELLHIVASVGPADWGEIFTHYQRSDGRGVSLVMKNFDRVADSLLARGFLSYDERLGDASITDAGRSALE